MDRHTKRHIVIKTEEAKKNSQTHKKPHRETKRHRDRHIKTHRQTEKRHIDTQVDGQKET